MIEVSYFISGNDSNKTSLSKNASVFGGSFLPVFVSFQREINHYRHQSEPSGKARLDVPRRISAGYADI